MKHVDLFNDFLKDTVNLNETRVSDLETSIEAIKDAVRASDWEPHLNSWMAHGSWAHKTIIRPVDAGEFDADLIVFVEHVDGWTAATYIDELYNAFRANATYKDKVNRSSHCVTVSYATEKKIDVAPCLTNRTNALEVCNRTTNQFEQTEPKQYTEWLVQKNGYSGSNSFRKVTRLVKYLRDIKGNFKCSSVLLTTLLGHCITNTDKDSSDFADSNRGLPDVRLVEPKSDGGERMDINPLGKTRFVAQEALQPGSQSIRERVGESRQQDSGIGVRPRQMSSPVQGDDGLAGAR